MAFHRYQNNENEIAKAPIWIVGTRVVQSLPVASARHIALGFVKIAFQHLKTSQILFASV